MRGCTILKRHVMICDYECYIHYGVMHSSIIHAQKAVKAVNIPTLTHLWI